MPSVVAPSSTTWASVPAMRDWTSPSKPFITASTTSSAVTPTATPATLIPVSRRTNPVRGRAFKYRPAIHNGSLKRPPLLAMGSSRARALGCLLHRAVVLDRPALLGPELREQQ